ncbi:MAG TPA: type II secretion system F family protein, partial [Chthoniobacterales bacterium]|nr:type II secretion system F family protein [Chthoniobacterales bacterium]
MPRFQYVALDARGQESTGSVEANSANEAIGHLRQAGYFPTGVYEQGKAPAARDGKVKRPRSARIAAPVVATPKRKTGITLFQRQKVKSKVLMIFTRQLATLIDS